MRILFAEDEKALSKALTTILERNNYSVDAVFDGRKQISNDHGGFSIFGYGRRNREYISIPGKDTE